MLDIKEYLKRKISRCQYLWDLLTPFGSLDILSGKQELQKELLLLSLASKFLFCNWIDESHWQLQILAMRVSSGKDFHLIFKSCALATLKNEWLANANHRLQQGFSNLVHIRITWGYNKKKNKFLAQTMENLMKIIFYYNAKKPPWKRMLPFFLLDFCIEPT